MYYINEELETPNRFNMRRFCEYNDDVGIYDEFTSYFLEQLTELKPIGTYTITNAECRPDIYCRDIYGSTLYWQLLLRYNNIINLNQLTLGTTLKYPALHSVEQIYFQLKALKGERNES